MEKQPRILSEEVISEQGSFKRVRRHLEGHHPELGLLTTKGWTGDETIQEVDSIRPIAVVTVYENGAKDESST